MDWKQYCKTNEAITLSLESKKNLLRRIKMLSGKKAKTRRTHWKYAFIAAACVLSCAFISGSFLLQRIPHKESSAYLKAFGMPFFYKDAYYVNINSRPKEKKYYEKYYNLPPKITKDMLGEQLAVITEEMIDLLYINLKETWPECYEAWQELYLGKNVYLPKNALDTRFLIIGSGDHYDYFVFDHLSFTKTYVHPDISGPALVYGSAEYNDYWKKYYELEDEKRLEFPIQRYLDIAGIKNAEDISCIEIAKLDYDPGRSTYPAALNDTGKKIEDTAFLLQFYFDIRDITPLTYNEYDELYSPPCKTLEDFEEAANIRTKQMANSYLLRFVAKNGAKMELIYHPQISTLERNYSLYFISEDTKNRLDMELKKVLEN